MSTIGTLDFYPIVFNSRSELIGNGFYEVIAPSAAGDLDLDDQYADVGHDPLRVIGRKSAKTLTLAPDVKGIRAGVKLGDTTFGRDLLESYNRGDVRGGSFWLRVLEDMWSLVPGSSTPLREVQRMRVLAVSAGVASPAYAATARMWGAGAPRISTRKETGQEAALLACYEFLQNVEASRNLKLQMRGLYYGSRPMLVELGVERRARRWSLNEARLQLAADAF